MNMCRSSIRAPLSSQCASSPLSTRDTNLVFQRLPEQQSVTAYTYRGKGSTYRADTLDTGVVLILPEAEQDRAHRITQNSGS